MSTAPEPQFIPFDEVDQLREARDILRHEAQALLDLSRKLDVSFCAAVDSLKRCTGTVVVSGMGKAGIIGGKIAATLASTGTRAHFLHPAEAVHGDLGCVRCGDVALLLSNSGETEEICRLLPIFRQLGVLVIAITGNAASTLGADAEVTIEIGRLREAGALGLAPTTSTTAMLALGDALALVVSRVRGFTRQQFALFHPGGSLGQRLKQVPEVMRRGDQLRIAFQDVTVREVLVCMRKPGRRTGAVMLVDERGRLSGLFTDSDLARLVETRRETQIDRSISEVMTRDPLTITATDSLEDAIERLSTYHISELPVVDADHRPVGLIDITDIVSLMPDRSQE